MRKIKPTLHGLTTLTLLLIVVCLWVRVRELAAATTCDAAVLERLARILYVLEHPEGKR